MDFVPPPPGIIGPGGREPQQASREGVYWGAIAFTARGSWSTAWKQTSQSEAEATVAKSCAKFGHGGCEVTTVSGSKCVALASFSGRRWKISYTAGGDSYPEATINAKARCNADQRTRGRCEIRTALCADGR